MIGSNPSSSHRSSCQPSSVLGRLKQARRSADRLLHGLLLGLVVSVVSLKSQAWAQSEASGWQELFADESSLEAWSVGAWNDVSQPVDGVKWELAEGVLRGGEPRGSWLMSQREWNDFELQFEFLLGERGNSGLALRAPAAGDPAFDGLELQMADVRYNPEAKASELTGGIYRAIEPRMQLYRPTQWNRYHVRLEGDRLWVSLNGTVIHDLDLDDFREPVARHDGTMALPIAQRPRQGRIGFQELSRAGGRVQIRGARIRDLSQWPSAHEIGRRMGRGVNMGNMLEAPEEGAWGLVLDEAWFALIKEAGFSHVRIPIRWTAHCQPESPFELNEPFIERVERAIKAATDAGLLVVINVHHDDLIMHSVEAGTERVAAIWEQLSLVFEDAPSSVIFELLNEPNSELTPERWNAVHQRLLGIVRQRHPERTVILGPGHWNAIRGLEALEWPSEDDRTMLTVHYYDPFQFTHQGASWVEGSVAWRGTLWQGTEAEVSEISRAFEQVQTFAKERSIPVYVGEFGAFSEADQESRVRWMSEVRRQCEARGFAWAYWEFASGFGIYDASTKQWRVELREALVPNP